MNRAIGLGNWCVGTLTALILAVGILSAPASAQVKPGDFITPDNAYKVRDLVSPGQYLRVMHGMTIQVTPTERIDWPPPYKDATEKYSSQVRLTPDHRSLIGYVAGEPFPIVDANDPDAGTKVMWNVSFRPISSDEYDLRWFDCDSVYWGRNAPFREITDIEVGHYAGYNEVGRTEVNPMPIDPDFKKTGRYFLGLLYPVLAPQDARGTGLIKFRYADPNIEDASWTWTPGARRVRRLNYAILDSATGAQAYDPNHYEGFSGKNENYDWKMLGEKNMLGAINIAKVPDVRCPTDGGASHCPDNWQMRHYYIIEGRPASRPLQLALQSRNYVHRFGSGLRDGERHVRSRRRAVRQLHVVDALFGSLGASGQNRDISVQARVPVRLVEHQRAEWLLHRLLPSIAGRAVTRLMVHQHGFG